MYIITRIQAICRGWINRREYKLQLEKCQRTILRWRIFIVKKPFLRLGIHVKIIQRTCRRMFHKALQILSCIAIQRIFRGMLGRRARNLRRILFRILCANRIKKCFIRYKKMKIWKCLVTRRCEAARIIQVLIIDAKCNTVVVTFRVEKRGLLYLVQHTDLI